ncbi:PREDICTED: uncharacterized protein LOC108566083 [Nicrophorus vespilloides]|uniref:Uncharacterized protein LOC108566083 n=1 Tax=Nicrophorus vespilloides TaxID=110193 RepID=A0ABM1N388_NICVS|nr:PREDICTED: uncharacterized protein LOC108566083 [Nicrophorus vespilloides]
MRGGRCRFVVVVASILIAVARSTEVPCNEMIPDGLKKSIDYVTNANYEALQLQLENETDETKIRNSKDNYLTETKKAIDLLNSQYTEDCPELSAAVDVQTQEALEQMAKRIGENPPASRRFLFDLNLGVRDRVNSFLNFGRQPNVADSLNVPNLNVVQDVQIRPPARVIQQQPQTIIQQAPPQTIIQQAPPPTIIQQQPQQVIIQQPPQTIVQAAPAPYIVQGRAPPKIVRPYVNKLPSNFRGYARDLNGSPVIIVDPKYQCDANYVTSYREAMRDFVSDSVDNFVDEYGYRSRDSYEQYKFKKILAEEVRRFTTSTLQKLKPCHGLYISIEAIYNEFDDKLDDLIDNLLNKL